MLFVQCRHKCVWSEGMTGVSRNWYAEWSWQDVTTHSALCIWKTWQSICYQGSSVTKNESEWMWKVPLAFTESQRWSLKTHLVKHILLPWQSLYLYILAHLLSTGRCGRTVSGPVQWAYSPHHTWTHRWSCSCEWRWGGCSSCYPCWNLCGSELDTVQL